MNNLLIMPKTATTFPIYPYQYIGGVKAASLWQITGPITKEQPGLTNWAASFAPKM